MREQRLSRLLSILGIVALFCLFYRLWVDNKEENRTNPEYRQGYEAYKQELESFKQNVKLPQLPDNTDEYGTNNIRANNFEGPEVSIEALEFFGKPVKKGNPGVLDYGLTNIAFDPDHPRLGLPDIEVEISSVTLHDPRRKGILKKVGSFFEKHPPEHRPYKVYYKEIVEEEADSSTTKKFIEMQLWLTEFNVTISAKPDRRKRGQIRLSNEEKNKKQYPSFWYGMNSKELLSAKVLDAEHNNRRYGNLKVWLRVKPNNSPWYVNNELGQTKKPEMAIGAIYCMELLKEPKEVKFDEISTSVGLGKELALYQVPEYKSKDSGAFPYRDKDYTTLVGSSVGRNDISAESIWNRDYFVKIYLKNFGSWKKGLLGERKYDDQLTYTFMMPILVEGAWNVHAPYEVIPVWNPDKPYYKDLKLVPDWGMKGFGKAISYGLLVFIGLGFLVLFSPSILGVFLSLFNKKK